MLRYLDKAAEDAHEKDKHLYQALKDLKNQRAMYARG